MVEIRSATIQELDALTAFGASPEFINARLREGSTFEDASKKLCGELSADNRELKIRVLALEARISADTGGPNGRPADKGTGDSRGLNTKRDQDAVDGTSKSKAGDSSDDNSNDDQEDDDDDDSGGTSATARWKAAVASQMRTKGMTRAKAAAAVAKKDPDLRAAFVKEANARRQK